MPKLSVVIITFNEETNIRRTLDSVKPIADEIVVVDSMSTDNTIDICREFGCKVYQREFDGYGTQKQFATEQASNDWIFSIDGDEVVTDELQKEILTMFTDMTGTGFSGPNHSGYFVHRSLHFMGKILRHSGVGKESLLRLFNRTKGGFTTVTVHEGVEVTGSTGTLQGRLIHYSYRGISHHLEKINTYTSLAAEEYIKKGRSFPLFWVALKFPATFLTVYIIKGGILDGYPGFMWSFLAAIYASLKVAKTIERSQKK
ncbi:MAG: glycosyltransferase family 2 protein [Bacteroidales bacterium]|nr:glycosyltransferase family 2 protein [Bacteroidales bacterium]